MTRPYTYTQRECDTASPSSLYGYTCTVAHELSEILADKCRAAGCAGTYATRPTLLEDKYGSFRRTKTLDIETLLGDLCLTLRHNIIDFRVRMTRVVVKEHQTFDPRLLRDLQGVEVGGMSPSDAVRGVFLWRVLGILDQEISLTRQGHVAGRFDEVPRRCSFTKGFVVGGVHQDFPISGEAVSQGTPGMIDHPGFYSHTVGKFHHAAFPQLHELDLCGHGMHRNRKIRTPHLARDDLFQGQSSMFGTENGQFRASNIGWGKKKESLEYDPNARGLRISGRVPGLLAPATPALKHGYQSRRQR